MFYMLFQIIRFFFCLIDFLLVTGVTLFCALLPRKINQRYMHKMFRLFCWSFIHLIGRRPHIHEKFIPPLPKQYIVIANHPSGYDLLIMNALFKVCPLAQSGVRNWFVIGKIAEAAGTVFVIREDKASRSKAKEACLEAALEGKNLLIYPEGGCARELRKFKYGAFDISLQTGIPIVPVYLLYEAENAFIWGDFGLLRHLINLFQAINKHTHCFILDPIDPKNFSDVESYSSYVHSIYENLEQKYRYARRNIVPSLEGIEKKEEEEVVSA